MQRRRVKDAGDAKAPETACRGDEDFSPAGSRWLCGGDGPRQGVRLYVKCWGEQAGAFICEVLGAQACGVAVDRVG
jgi:hypothetical protein